MSGPQTGTRTELAYMQRASGRISRLAIWSLVLSILHGLADAVGQFVLFGFGMGTVLAALTIATAWFGDGLLGRAQRLRRHINWASAGLLWLAGAYIVYYWLTAIGLA